jgi:hypothetical protein
MNDDARNHEREDSLGCSNKLTNHMQQFHKFVTWLFLSLNMFRAPPRPSAGAYNCINRLWFYRWSVGGSSAVGRGLARSRPTTLLPPRSKVKPEAFNAVVSGFGGLEVACSPLVPKFAGSHQAEAVGFLGRKNPQHAFLRRSKAVGPMS